MNTTKMEREFTSRINALESLIEEEGQKGMTDDENLDEEAKE